MRARQPAFRLWLPTLSLGLLGSLALSCTGEDEIPFIPLNSKQSPTYADTEANRPTLRVAVAPMISPEATARAYRLFLKYLENKVERPVVLIQRRTYGEVNELLRRRGVELAFVCSGAYVEGHRSFGMELLAAPMADDKATYHSYIIVSSQSGVLKFGELRRKRFAFTDLLSNTGFFYPSYLLKEMDQDAASFFSAVIFTYSHDRSVRAVAQQLVDAAAVDSLVYNQLVATDKKVGKSTRILSRSPPFGIPPVVVHPDLPSALKNKLQAVLLEMGTDPAASVALGSLGFTGFALISDAAYDSVRRLAAAVTGRGADG